MQVNSLTESESLADLRRTTEEIRQNTVAPKSRAIYQRSYSQFIAWLLENNESLITPEFAVAVGPLPQNALRRTKLVQAKLITCKIKPILFEQLEAVEFISWLVTLKKRDGSNMSYSAYNSHRSGLFNLFREYGAIMSKTLENELTSYFKGLKRTIATNTANGKQSIKTGKDPMPFELYKFICDALMRTNRIEMVFARTYMIISWNLMCRASNAFEIRFSHMQWSNDALQIFFAHMKNDQSGERPRDPRHIYANPLIPSVCPMVALGLYWSCFEFTNDDGLLFPGENQYHRFRKELKSLLDFPEVKIELTRRGIQPECIGTHSIRKGAATYCSSGSTSCPSSTAVHLRAGWSLGGVQNTYLRYEAAGDQYVGRTVSGLPINSSNFCILPPHFASCTTLVSQTIDLQFPNAPSSIRFILEFVLASLVYHAPFLRSILPATHPLLLSPVFSSPPLLQELRSLVVCKQSDDNDAFKPTGIPPHVFQLNQMDKLEAKIDAILNSRTTAASNVAPQLQDSHLYALNEIRDMLARGCSHINEPEQVVENANTVMINSTTPSISHSSTTLYVRDGMFSRLPQDFKLPRAPVYHMWLLWCCGHEADGIPPLKQVCSKDSVSRDFQRRMSDLRFLMHRIEQKASELGISTSTRNQHDAKNVYEKCKSVVDVSNLGEGTTRRRQGQLTWRTVVKLLRTRLSKDRCQ